MKMTTINQTKRKCSQVSPKESKTKHPKESKTKHPEIIKTEF